ncbi:hypothetical protein TPHA_0A05020 [Tetrapisispora phaffii CBS 4417]|uniref:RNA recognition motif domain-containing protein n=1 Tax=Tetrapisispora phaffii (strain ATCC 24235 / CBS 4417 / NBRC 1672 / NRRL Y-8282 / UCD 70-5) TaxID=1071381 RepID=G8BNU9_TETPH|nr:hypothetical protein TPHA_0A05020 [Tetrapisispora phaffii CBS 4417]CCE61577.1 hypothetical protein TPHA_0A05020 [Tetrapisispora phaffii CBS 4417]
MSNGKLVNHVLKHIVKDGNILGSPKMASKKLLTAVPETNILNNGKFSILQYNSYNSSLTEQHFLDIVPFDVRNAIISDGNHDDAFKLLQARDPKYFQFNNIYYLVFRNYKQLNLFINSTKYERINKIRVKFKIMKGNSMLDDFSKYHSTLKAANVSRDSYFKAIKDINLIKTAGNLNQMIDEAKSMGRKNLLVWNLPNHMKPHEIKDYFWFYNITDVFKLYWSNENDSLYNTLHFFKFADEHDCIKFRHNFHGTYFNDPIGDAKSKLLIEKLS